MGHEEVVRAYWRRVARDYQLKLVSKSGNVLRFSGFKENVSMSLVRFDSFFLSFKSIVKNKIKVLLLQFIKMFFNRSTTT